MKLKDDALVKGVCLFQLAFLGIVWMREILKTSGEKKRRWEEGREREENLRRGPSVGGLRRESLLLRNSLSGAAKECLVNHN